ncbi:MAG: AAA domain-containing protein [Desulfovibrio sp.]|uniref:sigma 54-interacting transcriptional regulator n=1 Tax=Desulfovibrio sp. TaxID=885 RepID=UPI00135E327D|nr:sigma 54-interacting transcriptional regulator [Desulfovibrio sp.]MTJ91625.1 AAA domain-containing protein [Desulfovibrio sp.]
MRLHRTLPQGNSLEFASFFMNRSLVNRMLMLGLPVLAVVLLIIFTATGSSIEDILDRAIARNAQLQSQAMRLALEQALEETRNQLLILAAGSMEQKDMVNRLKFRAKAGGLRYREIAFEGLTPDNRYLLVNADGEVINVPMRQALASPTGPFHGIAGEHRIGHVSVAQPVEVTYSMVPVKGSNQNISLYVLRFATPVQGADGEFVGYLMLSLDLRELRDIISAYSAPNAPIAAAGTDVRVRTLFFDREGWMLFQSEVPDAGLPQRSLATDAVRAGFTGDFGRPGFNTAFRPGPEHINYWNMVSDVQEGKTGQLALSETTTLWSNSQMRVERVSYVPVSFSPISQADSIVLGGLAVLDTSFTTTRTGGQLMGIYIGAFVGGTLLLGLSLWWLARQMTRSLNAVTSELELRNISGDDGNIDLPPMPRELERLKGGVNDLLERLRNAAEARRLRAAEDDAQAQREPVADLPHPEDLPVNGLIGTSPAMLTLCDNVRKASQVMADVLVVGETGTGKELVSEAIHRLSARSAGPFITINCGALDENLLMDTLFGHVKGAFTEARAPRKGAFLTAQGGTLMLDEVGNAAPKVQQALLRALSTRRIRPLGSDEDVPFDTRIIAATNASLIDDAQRGSFREDLYYRLAVITINTPPLRDRKSDIPSLTVYFLSEALKAKARLKADAGASTPAIPPVIPQISKGAMTKLMEYEWPGNVRELKNTLTRALAFCESGILFAEDIQLGHAIQGQGEAFQNENASVQLQDSRNQQDTPCEQGFCTAPPVDAGARANGLPGRLAEQPPAEMVGAQDESEFAAPRQQPDPTEPQGSLQHGLNVAEKLNRRIMDAWPTIAAAGSISRQEYQSLAGKDISMRTAQYDLQLLVQQGLVRKEGRGPAQRYVVIGR